MAKKSQHSHPGPTMEQVELTEEEQRVFNEIMEEMLPASEQETQEFLEGHRQESQGE